VNSEQEEPRRQDAGVRKLEIKTLSRAGFSIHDSRFTIYVFQVSYPYPAYGGQSISLPDAFFGGFVSGIGNPPIWVPSRLRSGPWSATCGEKVSGFVLF
jgi:hypothetical protein